jgi:dTDP-4-amino-4,6-dideoxygalactose transaminase
MTRENIGVGVHYLAIPEHPYYQEAYGWRPEQWPQATSIGRRTISLPLSAKLSDADVDDVVAALRKITIGRASPA